MRLKPDAALRYEAKVLFWGIVLLGGMTAVVGILIGLRPAVESLDWISERFTGQSIAFGFALNQLLNLCLILLLAGGLTITIGAGLGAFIAVLLRLVFNRPFRRTIGGIVGIFLGSRGHRE